MKVEHLPQEKISQSNKYQYFLFQHKLDLIFRFLILSRKSFEQFINTFIESSSDLFFYIQYIKRVTVKEVM